MAAPSHISGRLTRSHRWLTAFLPALLLVLDPGVSVMLAVAADLAPLLTDSELAGVRLIQDGGPDVQQKLGEPCQVPSANRQTVSYLYRTGEHQYLRFVLNVASFDVNYGKVESMTMSRDAPMEAPCYRSSSSSLSRPLAGPITGKGVGLGASLQQIMLAYGPPKQLRQEGSLTTLRYDSGLDADRYTEWILLFRDDRLIEWTVQSFPFFIESSG